MVERTRIDWRVIVLAAGLTAGCGGGAVKSDAPPAATAAATGADRKYLLETVDDAAVVQLYADGFESLPLKEKTLIWHLYQAALAGRDIFIDQKHRNALEMRGVVEAVVAHPQGVDAGDAGASPALRQAVLDQQRPLQQPHRAQVRAADARPTRSPRR